MVFFVIHTGSQIRILTPLILLAPTVTTSCILRKLGRRAALSERRKKAATARKQVDAYPDNAARILLSMESIERQNLQKAKGKVLIAQNASDAEIDEYTRKASMHQQYMCMLNNPSLKEAFGYLDTTITSSLREGGATYTDDFGSMRNCNGALAATQHDNNTRLKITTPRHFVTHIHQSSNKKKMMDRAITASLEEPHFLLPPYPISTTTAETCAAVSSAPSAPSEKLTINLPQILLRYGTR